MKTIKIQIKNTENRKSKISYLKRKIKFLNKKRRHMQICFQKVFFLYLKDFIFYKYICKMYILADIERNCRKSRFL